MKIEDIITLAKAGYTPKQVKELLEFVETSPKVQEAAPVTPEVSIPSEPQAMETVPNINTKDLEQEDETEKILANIFKED